MKLFGHIFFLKHLLDANTSDAACSPRLKGLDNLSRMGHYAVKLSEGRFAFVDVIYSAPGVPFAEWPSFSRRIITKMNSLLSLSEKLSWKRLFKESDSHNFQPL